jgi:hypothetical protein
VVAVTLVVSLAACVGDELAIEPGELDVRDLLGIAPSVAVGWDADQRASARELLDGVGPARGDVVIDVELGVNPDRSLATLSAMARADRVQRDANRPPILLARIDAAGSRPAAQLTALPLPSLEDLGEAPAIPIELAGWDAGRRGGWEALPTAHADAIAALATAAGHAPTDVLRVEPAPQRAFVAVYLPEPPVLLVNPLALAVAERGASDPTEELRAGDRTLDDHSGDAHGDVAPAPAAGNPYAFYGSIGECAAAQQIRCDACVPTGSCEQQSRDAASGVAECEQLAQDSGRGYFLFCANLSVAIGTVSDCAGDEAPACPQVTTASNQLAALDANAVFVDDAACRAGLDRCLARIYGDPDGEFPDPPADAGPVGSDAGTPPPPPPPPRDVDLGCGDQSCDFSPQCNASCGGGSCDNSFDCGSCDSDSSGCGGDGGGGGGGGGDGGGCDSGCSGDGGCDTGSCDSCSSSDDGGGGGGDDGGGCGGCGSSDDGGGGDDGGGCDSGCGGDGGGCDNSCDSSCNSDSGSGSGSCSIARQQARARWTAAVAVAWALFPLPMLMLWARRERRRRDDEGDDREVTR